MQNGNSEIVNVTLNHTEAEICEELAEKRYKNNRKENVVNLKVSDQPWKEVELDGLGAEFAVAKALNIYPDFIISARAGGVELVARNHARIDVKQTKYPDGRLLSLITKKDEDIDVFVLVTGRMPKYRIVGWCFSEELLVDENIVDLGYGPTYALTQDKLRPFSKNYIFPQLLNETRDWNTIV